VPLYEYQCKQCGNRFEKIQSFSAPEIKECPKCAGEVEKLISAPAIQFKGSGWYVSDYGKGGAAGSNTRPDTSNKGDSGSSSSGDGVSASSSESKPAASSSSDSGSSASSTSAAPAAPSSGSKKD
jgi:putative FmdB family regulatory protein